MASQAVQPPPPLSATAARRRAARALPVPPARMSNGLVICPPHSRGALLSGFQKAEAVFPKWKISGTCATLLRAVAGKDVEHPVVALMAGHLEERSSCSGQREFNRPRPDKYRWVLDGRPVGHGVGVGHREA